MLENLGRNRLLEYNGMTIVQLILYDHDSLISSYRKHIRVSIRWTARIPQKCKRVQPVANAEMSVQSVENRGISHFSVCVLVIRL